MKKNRKSLRIVLLLVCMMALIGSISLILRNRNETSSSNDSELPKLVDITHCSDVCPEQTQTYRVYEGIDDEERCEEIGGKVIKDPAWGGYIGCGPK